MTRKVYNSAPKYLAALAVLLMLPIAASSQASMSAPPGILHAAEAGKLLPSAVYFAGQSAPTQLRNSAGVRFAEGQQMLAVLVDSSGYSGGVKQTYQGYLLTEVPLAFGNHRLAPGAYGMGVVKDHFMVMDIGNHRVLEATANHDAAMHRPVPLQVVAAGNSSYRLCFGRECVEFRQTR